MEDGKHPRHDYHDGLARDDAPEVLASLSEFLVEKGRQTPTRDEVWECCQEFAGDYFEDDDEEGYDDLCMAMYEIVAAHYGTLGFEVKDRVA